MAATAMSSSHMNKSPPRHRRRIVTYGKVKQHQAQTFDDDFDEQPASRSTSTGTLKQQPRLQKNLLEQLPRPKPRPLKTNKAQNTGSNGDMFDVPSSDDEDTPRSVSPVKGRITQAHECNATASTRQVVTTLASSRAQQRKSQGRSEQNTNSSRKRKRAAIDTQEPVTTFQSSSLRNKTAMVSELESRNTINSESNATQPVQISSRPLGIRNMTAKRTDTHTTATTDSYTREATAPTLRAQTPDPSTFAQTSNNQIDDDHGGLSTPPISKTAIEHANSVTPASREGYNGLPDPDGRALPTPRQALLWHNLLDRREPDMMTDNIKFSKLNLHSEGSDSLGRKRGPAHRRRLVDTLEPSADDVHSSSSASDEDGEQEGGSTMDHKSKQEVSGSQTNVISSQESKPNSQHFSHGAFKNTYAGSRSYLEEPEMTLDELLSQPLEMDEFSAVKGGTSAKKDEFDFDDGMSDEDKPAIKSIHELRAKGETRRLENYISTLCDDLENHTRASLSGRRMVVFNLFKELTDPSFRGTFLQNSYETRVFSKCNSEKDLILGTGIAACLIRILDTLSDPLPASNIVQTGVTSTLMDMLKSNLDLQTIAKDRRSNMSRIGQEAVMEFEVSLFESKAFPDEFKNSMTPRLLSLKAFQLLANKANRSSEVVDSKLLMRLLEILETSPLEPLETDMALSILESGATETSLWTRLIMSRLVCILDRTLALSSSSTQALTVRLCISLTNNNPEMCEVFALPSFVSSLAGNIVTSFATQQQQQHSPEQEGGSTLDNLLLTIGAMLNLVEGSDTVRESLSEDKLAGFVKIFLSLRAAAVSQRQQQPLSKSEPDQIAFEDVRVNATVNVAGNYLALLLGNLCENSTVRSRIGKKVMGEVVEALDEFVAYNLQVDNAGDQPDEWRAFTKRLQNVVQRLRAFLI